MKYLTDGSRGSRPEPWINDRPWSPDAVYGCEHQGKAQVTIDGRRRNVCLDCGANQLVPS